MNEKKFTKVDNEFLKKYSSLGITPQEAMLVVHLLMFRWDDRNPYPSIQLLADMMGRSKSYVRKLTSSLEGKGFLDRVNRPHPMKGNDSNEYDLTPLIKVIDGHSVSVGVVTGGVGDGHRRSVGWSLGEWGDGHSVSAEKDEDEKDEDEKYSKKKTKGKKMRDQDETLNKTNSISNGAKRQEENQIYQGKLPEGLKPITPDSVCSPDSSPSPLGRGEAATPQATKLCRSVSS